MYAEASYEAHRKCFMGGPGTSPLEFLEKLYADEKSEHVRERILVVIHRKQGKPYRVVAGLFKKSTSYVLFWVRRFEKEGLAGLYNKKGRGRKSVLTEIQKSRLVQFIEQNSPTSREIRAYVQKSFGKSYHPFSIPRLLKNIWLPGSGNSAVEGQKRVFKKRQRSTWVWSVSPVPG